MAYYPKGRYSYPKATTQVDNWDTLKIRKLRTTYERYRDEQ